MTRVTAVRSSFRFCYLGDDVSCFLEGVVGGRYPTIDRLLQDDFLDVVRAETGLCQRRPHMHAELFPFIERQHGADHQDTARAIVVMRTRPYLAPGSARDEILKFLIECRLPGICTIDPGIAKHLAALCHSAVVAFLVIHRASPSGADEVENRLGVLLWQ